MYNIPLVYIIICVCIGILTELIPSPACLKYIIYIHVKRTYYKVSYWRLERIGVNKMEPRALCSWYGFNKREGQNPLF